MDCMTYNPDGGQFPKFEAIGNRIVFFCTYATDQGLNTLAGSRQFSPHFYIAENTFDFTEVDHILELIAPGGVGAYIIPRVYFSASTWWERDNPKESARIHTGESTRESRSPAPRFVDTGGALFLPYFSPISEINKSYLNRKRQSYVCGKKRCFLRKVSLSRKAGRS